jgi:hypothetical protein
MQGRIRKRAGTERSSALGSDAPAPAPGRCRREDREGSLVVAETALAPRSAQRPPARPRRRRVTPPRAPRRRPPARAAGPAAARPAAAEAEALRCQRRQCNGHDAGGARRAQAAARRGAGSVRQQRGAAAARARSAARQHGQQQQQRMVQREASRLRCVCRPQACALRRCRRVTAAAATLHTLRSASQAGQRQHWRTQHGASLARRASAATRGAAHRGRAARRRCPSHVTAACVRCRACNTIGSECASFGPAQPPPAHRKRGSPARGAHSLQPLRSRCSVWCARAVAAAAPHRPSRGRHERARLPRPAQPGGALHMRRRGGVSAALRCRGAARRVAAIPRHAHRGDGPPRC